MFDAICSCDVLLLINCDLCAYPSLVRLWGALHLHIPSKITFNVNMSENVSSNAETVSETMTTDVDGALAVLKRRQMTALSSLTKRKNSILLLMQNDNNITYIRWKQSWITMTNCSWVIKTHTTVYARPSPMRWTKCWNSPLQLAWELYNSAPIECSKMDWWCREQTS